MLGSEPLMWGPEPLMWSSEPLVWGLEANFANNVVRRSEMCGSWLLSPSTLLMLDHLMVEFQILTKKENT